MKLIEPKERKIEKFQKILTSPLKTKSVSSNSHQYVGLGVHIKFTIKSILKRHTKAKSTIKKWNQLIMSII